MLRETIHVRKKKDGAKDRVKFDFLRDKFEETDDEEGWVSSVDDDLFMGASTFYDPSRKIRP